MAKPVIEVNSLSKLYRLGVVGATTLREDLSRIRRRLFGKDSSASPDEFWALRDVSFAIQPGEVVGVLGRNGAGKSTLLKILARITEPTSGCARLRGRVASLLEVGTGFHNDLTGRENIYLNGAILGMKHREVAARFDEILAFAEVEKFIDTPVKHYSSGMRVRLAFAVAAHLEPEILIVDEVLAVGDAAFQTKCLGKMKEVSRQSGRTVLFVSHYMDSIRQLCQRILMLDKGRLVQDGADTNRIIDGYLAHGSTSISSEWKPTSPIFENPYFSPKRVWLTAPTNETPTASFAVNSAICINIAGTIETVHQATSVGLAIFDEEQRTIFWTFNHDAPGGPRLLPAGDRHLKIILPAHFLNEGTYRLQLMGSLTFVRWLFGGPGDPGPSLEFKIAGGFATSPYWVERRPGVTSPVLEWKVA